MCGNFQNVGFKLQLAFGAFTLVKSIKLSENIISYNYKILFCCYMLFYCLLKYNMNIDNINYNKTKEVITLNATKE